MMTHDLKRLELLEQFRCILARAEQLWATTHNDTYRRIRDQTKDDIEDLERKLQVDVRQGVAG